MGAATASRFTRVLLERGSVPDHPPNFVTGALIIILLTAILIFPRKIKGRAFSLRTPHFSYMARWMFLSY